MDESVRKMVDGAIEIESALEGKVVGAPDLIMLARLAGPLAREVLELDEKLRAAEANVAQLSSDLRAAAERIDIDRALLDDRDAEIERLKEAVSRVWNEATAYWAAHDQVD